MRLYNERDSSRLSECFDEQKLQDDIDDDEKIFYDVFHEDVSRLVHSPAFRRLGRKHQLLPSEQSDFVRTRSSHSNEVAQIATLLVSHLNRRLKFQGYKFHVRSDLLVFSGLAHDIGHPPFGHLGEQVLNDKMLDAGGFEGNAQTLRILTKLEGRFSTRRVQQGDESEHFIWDKGYGINPALRSLASVLKYSEEIPINDIDPENRMFTGNVTKGFYSTERPIVEALANNVSRVVLDDIRQFKTVEAGIMDYADDIAYSIYDLEDSFKSGVLRPENIMGIRPELLEKIASDIRIKVAKKAKPHASKQEIEELADSYVEAIDAEQIQYLLIDFFQPIEISHQIKEQGKSYSNTANYLHWFNQYSMLCNNDQVRRAFTESYIKRCVFDSDIIVREDNLPLSTVYIPRDTFILIEILKRVNYYLVIRSNLIGSSEKKSEFVLNEIFDRLYLPGDEFFPRARQCSGYQLLPDEVRSELDYIFQSHRMYPRDIFERSDKDAERMQVSGEHDLRSLCEKAVYESTPSLRGYSMKQILSQRDAVVRSSASNAIYRTLGRTGNKVQQELLSAFGQRRIQMKRVICDYIANMTDRSATQFFDKYIYSE